MLSLRVFEFGIVMQSIVMLSIVMLSTVMLSIIMLTIVKLRIVMLSIIMLSITFFNVMLNAAVVQPSMFYNQFSEIFPSNLSGAISTIS